MQDDHDDEGASAAAAALALGAASNLTAAKALAEADTALAAAAADCGGGSGASASTFAVTRGSSATSNSGRNLELYENALKPEEAVIKTMIGEDRARRWHDKLLEVMYDLGECNGVGDEWNILANQKWKSEDESIGSGVDSLKKFLYRGARVEFIIETKLVTNPKAFDDDDVNQLYRYMRAVDELTCGMAYGEGTELVRLPPHEAPSGGILAVLPKGSRASVITERCIGHAVRGEVGAKRPAQHAITAQVPERENPHMRPMPEHASLLKAARVCAESSNPEPCLRGLLHSHVWIAADFVHSLPCTRAAQASFGCGPLRPWARSPISAQRPS